MLFRSRELGKKNACPELSAYLGSSAESRFSVIVDISRSFLESHKLSQVPASLPVVLLTVRFLQPVTMSAFQPFSISSESRDTTASSEQSSTVNFSPAVYTSSATDPFVVRERLIAEPCSCTVLCVFWKSPNAKVSAKTLPDSVVFVIFASPRCSPTRPINVFTLLFSWYRNLLFSSASSPTCFASPMIVDTLAFVSS